MDDVTPVEVPALYQPAEPGSVLRAEHQPLAVAAARRGLDWASGEARRRRESDQAVPLEWPCTLAEARARLLDLSRDEAVLDELAHLLHRTAAGWWPTAKAQRRIK